MHQQFLNAPMENCDPQLYLGQGRFSNLSHHLKGHTTTAAVAPPDLEEVTRLRMLQPEFCPAPNASSSNSCIQRRQPVDTSGLKCPIIMMNNPFMQQTDRDRTAEAMGVEVDPVRDMSFSQPGPARDMSYSQPGPARDMSYSQQDPARDMSYSQQDPARDMSFSQPGPARDMSYSQPGPARDMSYSQPGPARDMSYSQPGPVRDMSYSQPGPARDMSYSQQDPARDMSYSQLGPARDMSYFHQNIEFDQSFFGRSDQVPEYPNHHHHHVQEMKTVQGCNQALQSSKHRTRQYQPGSSSEDQPQIMLCDCDHGCDNDAQIAEGGNLNVPLHTHLEGQHVQGQTDAAAHFPPVVGFLCGQESGLAGTVHGTHSHSQPPHSQSQRPHKHSYNQSPNNNNNQPLHSRNNQPAHNNNNNQPPYNYSQPHHTYSQLAHNQSQPPHNYSQLPHNQGQPPHNYSQLPHSQSQVPDNYTEIPHNQSQPPHNYSQPPHNYSQPPHNQNQPPHNYSQPPHNHSQPPHNHSQPPHNQNQPPHNYSQIPHNQSYPPHNYSQPQHNMDCLLDNHIPQVEQHPKMTRDRAAPGPCFLATSCSVSDSQTHRGLPSQPMFAEVTASYHRQHPHIPRGQHPHTIEGEHSYRTLGHCPTNRPGCDRLNMSEPSPGVGAYRGRHHQLPGVRRGYRHNTDIRAGERFDIQNHLLPGRVVQVHGAPMTGKSTLVRQAVSDAISNSARAGLLCDHHISCKGVTSFQDFLSLVAQSWSPQPLHGRQPDTDSVLNMIGLFLQENPHSHHILVFHKCENLRVSPHSQQFLEFLAEIVNELASLSISIVFTTYKHYWTPPKMSIGEVEVDVLSVIDIIKLLQYYVPHIDDFVSYANVLAKTFCFPEAIRLIAEEYLVVKNCHVTPEKLEKIINKNQDLLSQLFEHRLPEVDTWVSKQDLRFLTHFMHSIENSFTEAHLEYVNSSDLDQVHLQKMISYLKKNHLVRSLPGIRRLVIHPLIVYHSMVSSDRDRQLLPERWLDNTRNRYIHFLGRVLMSIEANMHAHGRKGLVFAGLIQEWPNVQYVFQMALHCNRNTYENFVKVAITASNYILKIFPREAESFYWSLYNSAKDYGTPVEFAVMEAFLGQAIAEGTGKDWGRANQYLSSAIEQLSRFGNSYFLGWAIVRKAIIHHRQGKYQESIEYFQQASRVLNNVDRWALGEEFLVPEPKIDEELITQRIHMTIPIIFTGRNTEARRRLDAILDLIQNCCENHPDIATLLNLIGLTEQRGNRDTQRALLWYKLSYNERMYWAKACPESLLAVLNNIGMIYFYQGDCEESMKYLEKALAIRRECGWTHYNTGLTLVHVAEINMKIGNLVQAYKLLLEAERIFSATVKDHDMRLRVNFDLAHIRVLIRQALEPRNAAGEFSRRRQSQESLEERPAREESSSRQRDVGAKGVIADACSRTGQRKTSWDTSGDSVTSSQLLEAGSASQQFTNATHHDHHHHHHRQHSEDSSLPFPACEDILRINAADIEPCDLRMSASDYFERILAIAGTIQGTLSDDGLSLVLCSREHLMLLNLGNSPEKFEEHRTALAAFSEDNPWLDVDGDTDTGVDSTYRCLIKHKPLYSYVQRTPYECLEIPTFIQHMMKACLTCKFIDDSCRMETWETEAVNCMQNREIRTRLMQEFDKVRSYTQSGQTGNDITSSAAVTKVAEGSGFVLPGFTQSCVSAMFDAQNVQNDSSTRSETRALPDFQELLSPENSVHNGDRVEGIHRPIDGGQGEGHRQTPKQFLNQLSVVSPRIARTQEEILKTIQSKRAPCSLAASVEAEKSLPGGSGVSRKSYDDRGSTAVPGVLTCRQPVEQSYHGEVESNRFSGGNISQSGTLVSSHTLASTNILNYRIQPSKESQTGIENLGQRKNGNSECSKPRRQISGGTGCNSRQILADAERRSVVTDRVSDTVLPDELSKPQLVLEQCRSEQPSQSDLTSGKTGDLRVSISEQTSGQNSPGNKISKAQNDKFSVLEYIRNGFNNDMYTSAEPAGTASSSHQEETQQLPCEDVQVAGVQEEKEGKRHAGPQVSIGPGLRTRTLPSASPSSLSLGAALYSENYLRRLTASASKHEQQSISERQHESLQPRLDLQCLGSTEIPDGSRDSGHVSASVHNINNSGCASRHVSDCESSAFSRSRLVSSSSLSSSGHHAYSHRTSASESGYSSEQQLTCLTGMLTARPVEGALSSARYHQNYVSDPGINRAFSDILFPSSAVLLAEAGGTDTSANMSSRECTPSDNMLAVLTYLQTLAQMPGFPDQSVFSQADPLWLHAQERQQLPQADNSQTDNQVSDIRHSLLPENSNSLIFREAVEQSWNETLMPDFTQLSAEVGDMSASGCTIRQELLLLENHIRQREYDSSSDSEEVTLAENIRSSKS